jgi:FlaA1/EpsC-like NDP-sugar epimerase
MEELLNRVTPFKKTLIAMVFDAIVAMASIWLSLILRIDDYYLSDYLTTKYFIAFGLMALTQVITFHLFGLYRGIWRYSSTLDLIRLIKAVSTSILFSIVVSFLLNRLENIPRTIFFIDWLLLIVCLGGGRLGYRMFRESKLFGANSRGSGEPIIIVGAGMAGEQLVREIHRSRGLSMYVAALVDDDQSKHKKMIHGVSIMGGLDDIAKVVDKTGAKKVIVAIPSAGKKLMKSILEQCVSTGLEIKTLPNTQDILGGKISFSQLRDVAVEDLLGREEVELEKSSINSMLKGARVMVTGAGGSIGSELCLQIAKFNPKCIIFFEQSEFNLYQLEIDIKAKFEGLNYVLAIGDVRDKRKVEKVISEYRPDVIFHAAAYKHVPLMEFNPAESIHSNSFGTRVVGEAAVRYGVDRFVMVSTDKAVNPTNVMGATKRIAEMICQKLQGKTSTTKFMIVRFGNVLGSSGSVIPFFKKQIQNGGPVTVTHPEITRYFMSIPEACQLVLQAGALGEGSEIFVLDMGDSVKILDLAKQMIALSGFTEDEIEIKFTGLRPGEKLYEELLLDGENTLPTVHPLLKIAQAQMPKETFVKDLQTLWECVSENGSSQVLKEIIKGIVPEYTPSQEEGSQTQNKLSLH